MKKTTVAWLGALLCSCAGTESGPVHLRAGVGSGPSYEEDVLAIVDGPTERRYHALRDLERFEGAEVRALLRRLLRDGSAIDGNACARSLITLGEARATEALIANLGPGIPDDVARDAEHHLRTIYGWGEPYEPALGFQHRRAVQARWWAYWADQPEGRMHARPTPRIEFLRERETLRADLLRLSSDGQERLAAEFHELVERSFDAGLHEDVLAARQALEAWVTKQPEDLDARLLLARATCALGDCEPALRMLREAFTRRSDARFLVHCATIERGLGRVEDSAMTLHAVPERERTVEWFLAWAWTSLARERAGDAIDAFARAEELDPAAWTRHRLWRERLVRSSDR